MLVRNVTFKSSRHFGTLVFFQIVHIPNVSQDFKQDSTRADSFDVCSYLFYSRNTAIPAHKNQRICANFTGRLIRDIFKKVLRLINIVDGVSYKFKTTGEHQLYTEYLVVAYFFISRDFYFIAY